MPAYLSETEETRRVGFRAPISSVTAMERYASENGLNLSAAYREAVALFLLEQQKETQSFS